MAPKRKLLKKGTPDLILLLVVLGLLCIGLLMVFSSSFAAAGIQQQNPYFYLKRQGIWVLIGLVAMFVTMKMPLNTIRKLSWLGFKVTIALLVLVFVTGEAINGSTRWLGVGSLGVSPSDLAKPVMVLCIADLLAKNSSQIQKWKGILGTLIIAGFCCGLVLVQPDLGTTFSIAGTVFFMLWAAGARKVHLGIISLAGGVAAALSILLKSYQLVRLTSFLDPFDDPTETDFQIVQSLYALGSGGLSGLGIGQSRQKFFYLPERHTDFIFSILGEEMGFIGCLLVILLFLLLAWRGIKIAMEAEDRYMSVLATGMTSMIILQACINMGVVTALLPITGITLPFISYGGSSMLFTMVEIGILLNISRYTNKR